MKRSYFGSTLAIGSALVLTVALARAADDLPKADTILDKYVEATGGKAAYQKHHSEIHVATMEIPSAGLKAKMTSYHVEPNKSYSEVEFPGIGKMQEGTDGTVYWSLSAMQGPHVKEGPERAQAVQGSRFNSELNWRELYKQAETTGTDTVDGKECYQVKLTPTEGGPVTQCYDKASGLLVKATMTIQSPMGEQVVNSYTTDYRKEGDLLVPHKIKQSLGPQEFTITLESVTYNGEIPKDRFDLPAEIKALVKK